MDDLMFLHLQKSFPGIEKPDIDALMKKEKIDPDTVMNWARLNILAVGNNGLTSLSTSVSSVDPETL